MPEDIEYSFLPREDPFQGGGASQDKQRPSRTGNNRLLDGSRGHRRRSSVLSTDTVPYEDGEADDDSDLNRDGDITMSSNPLQPLVTPLLEDQDIGGPTEDMNNGARCF
jgi:hypothetical protein